VIIVLTQWVVRNLLYFHMQKLHVCVFQRKYSFFFINEYTFHFFINMEKIFRFYYEEIHLKSLDIKNFYFNRRNDLEFNIFLTAIH